MPGHDPNNTDRFGMPSGRSSRPAARPAGPKPKLYTGARERDRAAFNDFTGQRVVDEGWTEAPKAVERADTAGGANTALQQWGGMPSGRAPSGPTPTGSTGSSFGGTFGESSIVDQAYSDPHGGFLSGGIRPDFRGGTWVNRDGTSVSKVGAMDAEGNPVGNIFDPNFNPGAAGYDYQGLTPPQNEEERLALEDTLASLQEQIASGSITEVNYGGQTRWVSAITGQPVANPLLLQALQDIPRIQDFLDDYNERAFDLSQEIFFNDDGTVSGTGPNGAITAQDWSQIGVILASKGADAAMQQTALQAQQTAEALERSFTAWQTDASQEHELDLLAAQQAYGNAQFAAQQEMQVWQQTGQWEHEGAEGAANRDLATWQTTQQQEGQDRRQASAQTWQTAEREGAQTFQTGERLGGQDWQSGERALDRTFEMDIQDDQQDFQFSLQRADQEFTGQENQLNRQLEKYKADLQNAVQHRNLDVISERNRQIRVVEQEQARMGRKKFKLEVLQSFSAAPEMLYFMSQNADPKQIFGELFADAEGSGGGGAALEQAFTRMLDDVQDPRFAANIQTFSQMGSEGQAQAGYAHTARTGDRNPQQTFQGQAPLSMPSRNPTRQTQGRIA